MTVKELITELSAFDHDRVCVISDGEGWSNIETVFANDQKIDSSVHITVEHFPVFSE